MYRMETHVMGINYGRIANDLPAPDEAIQRIKAMKVGRVKIFNSDATVLSALANTGLEVVSALPNEDIPGVARSQTAADLWVNKNVLPYYPATNIVAIIVGNELFSYPTMKLTWAKLMPAITNIHTSLANHNLTSHIKLSTAVALDVLASSYPPSAGAFREELVGTYLQPLLKFLYNSQSHFYVNVYPYFAWASDPDHIPLNYALFGASSPGVTDNGNAYYNLLDGQLDAVNAALDKVGYGGVRLAISETGWPTAGDANQVGANLANAATYNRRLVRKMLSTSKVWHSKWQHFNEIQKWFFIRETWIDVDFNFALLHKILPICQLNEHFCRWVLPCDRECLSRRSSLRSSTRTRRRDKEPRSIGACCFPTERMFMALT